MDPLTLGLLAGAGLGLAKSELIDAPQADRQRKLESVKARYSPWTGIKPNEVKEADPFGSALQFGTTGAMLGQGIQQTNAQNDLMATQKAYLQQQMAQGIPQEASAQVYQPGMGMGMLNNAPAYTGYSNPWLYMPNR